MWLDVRAVVRCVPGVEWTEEESHPLHGGQEAEGEREEGRKREGRI